MSNIPSPIDNSEEHIVVADVVQPVPRKRIALDMSLMEYPTQMWVGFFNECGLDEMLMTFRWDSPPIGARHGESVFAFYLPINDTENLVGWGSLKRDPCNGAIMEVVRGVRPKYRNMGHADTMLKMLSHIAFEQMGADVLFRSVYDTNVAHAARNLDAADRGSPWVYAGRVWYPDPYRIFTYTKDSWLAGDVL